MAADQTSSKDPGDRPEHTLNRDLSDLLREWAFEPGKINVRIIRGNDGEPRIQVRLDLGLLQMRTEGRPDGDRPHGYESLLEYHEARADQLAEPTMTEAMDPGERFELSPEDCRALREEAVQYYHRYIALLVVDDYDGVVRDTTRNLRVLDLCAKHATEEDDRAALEQFRPYIMMMRARALASRSLKDNEPKAAIFAIDQGLNALKKHFEDLGHPEAFEESSETGMLRGMREALVPKLPVSQKSELHQRLQEALDRENYELAAILRDELRLMRE